MAHSTTVPAASNKPATHTDWYTFLRSALIDGLKAYGVSMMAGAPWLPVLETWETSSSSPKPAIHAPQVAGAPGPSHLGTWETKSEGSKVGLRKPLIPSPQSVPSLPQAPAQTPVWSRA
jgi:hypothetical protein